jgi:hypothetical protein
MANSTDGYIPGACNIGREEVRWRRIMAWIGVVVALGLWGFFAYAEASPPTRLWVGGPALMAALGFLQARRGFCVKYGLGGAFNFGPEVGRTESVEQAEARRQDRRASIRLIAQAVLIAALVALAAYATPV